MSEHTDRELLELAAKAAGVDVRSDVEKFIVQPNYEHIGGFIVRNDKGGDSCWNPLRDDGDALRLAVKLGLVVAAHKRHAIVSLPYEGEALCHELYGSAPYAATRRAIVRAAAAIAKAEGKS